MVIHATVLLLPTLALGATTELTHGVSVGEVTTDTAIVWGRCSGAAALTVQAKPTGGVNKQSAVTGQAQAMGDGDFTAQVELKSLKADQPYEVTVVCTGEKGTRGKAERATFRTAPLPDQSRPISFIVGADLGGQTYCRPKDGGYRIFKPMTALKPDFFIANGDMIYADDHCPERGFEPDVVYIPGGFPSIADRSVDWTNPESLDVIYRDHWKYNRADPAFQEFLRSVPQYVQWDDHEVVNDFGAQWFTTRISQIGPVTRRWCSAASSPCSIITRYPYIRMSPCEFIDRSVGVKSWKSLLLMPALTAAVTTE